MNKVYFEIELLELKGSSECSLKTTAVTRMEKFRIQPNLPLSSSVTLVNLPWPFSIEFSVNRDSISELL